MKGVFHIAKRRCISIDFYNSEAFCELSAAAKNLYTYLMLNCDDDGVVINPKAVYRVCKSNKQTMDLLCDKKFLLCVDGVYVIRHWRVHNTIQPSRKIGSIYREKLLKLYINDQKEYCFIHEDLSTNCQPNLTKLNLTKTNSNEVNSSEVNSNQLKSNEQNSKEVSSPQMGADTSPCDDTGLPEDETSKVSKSMQAFYAARERLQNQNIWR